jgi:hypothetical protein
MGVCCLNGYDGGGGGTPSPLACSLRYSSLVVNRSPADPLQPLSDRGDPPSHLDHGGGLPPVRKKDEGGRYPPPPCLQLSNARVLCTRPARCSCGVSDGRVSFAQLPGNNEVSEYSCLSRGVVPPPPQMRVGGSGVPPSLVVPHPYL